ncbi:MAG TPA: hypothetical protein VET86_14725 [Casimicrobiaceae bacterium]|nr:hypothetical protein [Casimicrobiaceae bacterium]
MAERRTTLLDFAIAASAAVVPVLLLVLLAVGVLRPADSTILARNGDRHVSVRQVAALQTFEHAIVRRAAVEVGPPSGVLLLDGLPQCRSAWDGHGGMLDRLRGALASGGAAAPTPAERLAAHLAELDAELARFGTGANRRVSEPVGFDSARWFDAVAQALEVPVEAAEYPGRRFTVQCADIAHAAWQLARGNGRMLHALSWRGTEVARVVARWRPDQMVAVSARQLARGNPWLGLPGCVFLGGGERAAPAYFVTGGRAREAELCARPELFAATDAETQAPAPTAIPGEASADLAVNDARWKVPPSLDVMLQPLATLRRPSGSLYRLYTEAVADDEAPTGYRHGPNRIDLDGSPVDVGFSLDLTIDPALQELAQKVAACYTGRHDVCGALGIARHEDDGHPLGYRMLEQAMVRMAAIAVIDVASGRIEALAGTLTPCAREEYDGPGRDPKCDKRLPYAPRYRPDALLNPAVFHDAMPASVIKPIMAEAFLADPDVGARWLAAERASMRSPGVPAAESLRGELMRSVSARFLDRMFCSDQGFTRCARPWRIQAMAAGFGWNGGCATPREDCGKRDLLFGRAVDASAEEGRVTPLALVVPYGRLLTEPVGGRLEAPFYLRPEIALDPGRVRTCAAAKWEKCSGGVVVDVVAEGWGQGHARASALGVAGMMTFLAAAANGQEAVREPHLVSAIRGVGGEGAGPLELAVSRFGLDQAKPGRLAHDAAEVILSGLSYSHRAGTARLACEQVFDARACRDIDWIAGKTGTPTFPNDDRSLDELWRLCARGGAKTKAEQAACGPLRPYKWYVAAYRADRADPRWTKVIAVLTERNWVRETGRIHGAGDHGPNPAAEIALQVAARHGGYLPGDRR